VKSHFEEEKMGWSTRILPEPGRENILALQPNERKKGRPQAGKKSRDELNRCQKVGLCNRKKHRNRKKAGKRKTGQANCNRSAVSSGERRSFVPHKRTSSGGSRERGGGEFTICELMLDGLNRMETRRKFAHADAQQYGKKDQRKRSPHTETRKGKGRQEATSNKGKAPRVPHRRKGENREVYCLIWEEGKKRKERSGQQ